MNVIKSLTKLNLTKLKTVYPLLKLSRCGSQFVSVTEDPSNGTATLSLQKPPVNSLNLELLEEITSAIKELEKKKARGFVLTSSSPTIFSGGLDIMEMYKAKEQRFRAFWKSLQEMWKALYSTPLITIAAVNGHAPAGGCMMALCCDYRIMLDGNFTIGMNETQLGIAAPKWFRTLLINSIGFRQSEKALLLGTLYSPQQALSLGLIDELVSNKDALEKQVAAQMALWLKVPDAARQITKVGMRKPIIDEFCSYQDQELENLTKLFQMDSIQKPLEKYMQNLKSKKL